MAGHLLATVNPEAAAEIKPDPVYDLADLPKVGDIVQFLPRPGEMRPREGYAMYVTNVNTNGNLDGVVIIDAQDFKNVERLPPKTEHHPWPAWDWRDEKPFESDQKLDMEWLKAGVELLEKKFAALEIRQSNLENRMAGYDLLQSRGPRIQSAIEEVNARLLAIEERINRLPADRITINPAQGTRLEDIEARLDALEDNHGGAPAGRKSAEHARRPQAQLAPYVAGKEIAHILGEPRVAVKKKRRKAKRAPLIPSASD